MQNAQKVARALGDICGMSGKGAEHGASCLRQSLCRTCQKKRAAFALGMLFGLRGALARALDFLRALPLGFAVGGVLTSGGGTGPPLAKYRFFFSTNLTCIDAEHCLNGLRPEFAGLHRHANGAAACEHYLTHTNASQVQTKSGICNFLA